MNQFRYLHVNEGNSVNRADSSTRISVHIMLAWTHICVRCFTGSSLDRQRSNSSNSAPNTVDLQRNSIR